MKNKSLNEYLDWSLWAGLGFCVLSAFSLKADTLVTFSVDMSTNILLGTFIPGTDTVSARGTFNGYGTFDLVQAGSSTVYTNTVDDTTDPNGGELQYKFYDSNAGSPGWENTASGQNRCALLPTNSGASLVLPTAFYSDDGAPVANNVNFQVDVAQQVALGNFTPGTSYVEVRGLFNGWTGGVTLLTNDPTILRTNQYGVTSNVWVGSYLVTNSPGGAEAFKYVLQPGTFWDAPSPANADGGGNRYFANVAQTLPLVNFADEPYAPIVQVTFNVDMSIQTLSGAFSNYPAYLAGSFNNWGTTTTLLTNNPSAPNTNIYSATVVLGYNSTVYYKFTYQNNGTVWENPATVGGGNRTCIVPPVPGTNVPTVYFSDLLPDDVFLAPTPVTFELNMTNAVGYSTNVGGGHVFDPSSDNVYINGQFANNGNWYAWGGGINPAPAPPGNQMMEQGLTTIYTNTIIVPPGTPVGFAYKYGMDPGGVNGGPLDDEAGFGLNHLRVVRTTVNLPYTMPGDTFGYQYQEPFFNYGSTAGGDLTIGPASGGSIPVTWLGRPGAHLQVGTSLSGGSWQDIVATDGTNWTLGYSSTNGFVSQTNWPASGNAFFRLVKP